MKGMDVDVIREAAREAKIKIDLVLIPWSRILQSVELGIIDGGFPAFKRPEREIYASFMSIPLRKSRFSVFVHPQSKLNFENIGSLKGLMIAQIRGYSIGPEFDLARNKKLFQTFETSTTKHALKMVAHRRVDAFVNDHDTTLYEISNMKLSTKVKVLEKPVGNVESVFLFLSKKKLGSRASQITGKLDKALSNMRRDGRYEKILERYINPKSYRVN